MSMCFAFSDTPCRVALLLPAVEFVCMRMFTFDVKPDSCRNIYKWSPSLVPVQIASSSLSAGLNAIVACVREPKLTGVPRM